MFLKVAQSCKPSFSMEAILFLLLFSPQKGFLLALKQHFNHLETVLLGCGNSGWNEANYIQIKPKGKHSIWDWAFS